MSNTDDMPREISPVTDAVDTVSAITDKIQQPAQTEKRKSFETTATSKKTSSLDQLTYVPTSMRKTRTAPYSHRPFHRPFQTGDNWGQGGGNIPSPFDTTANAELRAARNWRGDRFAHYAKVYIGLYTFLFCLAVVLLVAFARWAYNGCEVDFSDLKNRKRKKSQQASQDKGPVDEETEKDSQMVY